MAGSRSTPAVSARCQDGRSRCNRSRNAASCGTHRPSLPSTCRCSCPPWLRSFHRELARYSLAPLTTARATCRMVCETTEESPDVSAPNSLELPTGVERLMLASVCGTRYALRDRHPIRQPFFPVAAADQEQHALLAGNQPGRQRQEVLSGKRPRMNRKILACIAAGHCRSHQGPGPVVVL